MAAGVLSTFFGINEYASGADAIVRNANNNQARYRALNIAAETLLQSRVTTGAFARDDRAGLVALMEPFYETLHKSHGIEQLNFWLPPAKVYYRAGSPQAFGMDLSSFRKSIVAANDRRTRISAVETGLGGVIALRVITPVFVEEKFVGVIEFVSNFDIPLERASDTSGLKWAVSLMKEVSDRVERPADPKNDAWQGTDVYYRYSDPITAQTVRSIKFDPRSKEHSLASADGRTIYVKAFPVVNFSGIPTITIATLLDVTQPFAEVFRLATIKSGILFLLASILGSLAVIKFGQIKASLGGALSRQKKELDERILSCDAAVAKLREVDVIKRGFFTNLVTAVNEPLQAVVGQLKALPPAFEAAGASRQVIERLQFALSETTRLSRLVEDYQQIEMFRQKLVKSDYPAVSLAAVVAKTLEEDLVLSLRLPQLSITSVVPADLPPTRADAGLLRRAIASLIGYAAQRVGRGRIVLSASQDDAKWLVLSITGSAFTNEGAPSEALLDESRQFMARLASGANQSENGGTLIILGIAVRDIILALFTGIVLNIEKPFKEGDTVRIGDKYWGKVIRITWRTTVLQTGNKETIFIPNISLANAVILNLALPDACSKRSIEVVIDYDTSVESAERILYAAAIGAVNVKHVGAPSVFARKMERDGVLYEVSFTITDYADGTKSEHAVIKSILQCMRDAEITVSFPKSEVIQSQRRVSIANRSLDVFHLVQQCRLFRGLPDEVCHRISKVLVERHFVAGAPIVQAGERRYALFIVGEGMARRTLSNRDGSTLVQERFIATELFGRRSLFACQPQVATVLAESAVLLYELDRRALARLFEETPDLIDTLAQALSHLSWNESNVENPWVEPPPEVIERLVNLYQGQLEANYGERSVPTRRSTAVTA